MDKIRLNKANELSEKINSLQKELEFLRRAIIKIENMNYIDSYVRNSIADKNPENKNDKLANETVIMVYKNLKKKLKKFESAFKNLYPDKIKSIKYLKDLEPKLIGRIGVDAGIVWIGDPCYIMQPSSNNPKSIGKDYSEFLENLGESAYKSFLYDSGSEGAGICTSTKHGDGIYNVIGYFEKNVQNPSAVIILFDDVLSSLVCSITQKQILNQDEWEK